MQTMTDTEKQFENALLAFDKFKAQEILMSLGSVEERTSLIVKILKQMGDFWEKGDLALSQIYMSGRICEELIDSILPKTSQNDSKPSKIAIVTLSDYHVLGKRVIYSSLRAAGFDLIDYGHGVTPENLCDNAIRDSIEILLISTLMLPSALKVRDVRDLFDSRNYKIKILVGGAPYLFDHQLWQQVGADRMGSSPKEAIEILTEWTGN